LDYQLKKITITAAYFTIYYLLPTIISGGIFA